MHDHVNRLHYDIEVMTRRLELEKRRLVRLEKELAVARRNQRNKVAQLASIKNPKRVHARPSSRNGNAGNGDHARQLSIENSVAVSEAPSVNAATVEVTPDQLTPARVLVNRLDHKRKRLNVVNSDCKHLHEEVNQLRRARLQCNIIFDRLRGEIKARSNQLADFVEETASSHAVYDDVKQRQYLMKGQREHERSSFKSEVMRLREQLKFHEREKKEVEVQLRRADDGVQRKRGLIVPPEEEEFSEPVIMRRIMKTAFLNCIQRRHIRNHQKSIEVFEQAFSTIKQSTGIEHIEEIVKIFVNLESRNYSLLTYVNHMNREIEALEMARRERKNMDNDQKRAAEQQQQLRQDALQDVDKNLQTTERAIASDRELSAQHNELLFGLQRHLKKIIDRIDNETSRLRAPNSGGQATAGLDTQLQKPQSDLRTDTLPEWLQWVEQALGKFRDLLPSSDRESAFPYTAAAQVKTLQPKRMGGHAMPITLVNKQELPTAVALVGPEDAPSSTPGRMGYKQSAQKEFLDDESEEDDFNDRPLKPAELRQRAEHARNRKNKRLGRAAGGLGASTGFDKQTTGFDKQASGVVDKLQGSSSLKYGSSSKASAEPHAGSLPETSTKARPDLNSSQGRPSGGESGGSADAAAGVARPNAASFHMDDDDADMEVANAAAGAEAKRDAGSGNRVGRESAVGMRPESKTGGKLNFAQTREVSEAELNIHFLRRYKMSKQELQVMADRMGIHLSHLCHLKAEFDVFDEDRTGYVDVRELRSLLHKLGEENLSEEELEEAFRDLDGSNSGEIEFFEFVEWFAAGKNT